ncbi:hypothetical protein BDQ17DRAFT_1506420 [Cyathus striatus]|nr:hypothetical protein BDQ17DRAFT_1506420 [Cyathus striatus]
MEVGGDGILPRSINTVRIGGSISVVGFISRDKRSIDNFAFQLPPGLFPHMEFL